MDGVLLVNKPKGLGSSSLVYKLRRILGTKDIGHCGTLDPLAEGLMIIVIGKALKISRFLLENRKEYIATLKLGILTPTLDLESEVIERKEVPNYSEEEIKKVLESFLGKSLQTPPLYSALSVNGKKLYEYARNNQKVEVKSREIEIHNITLLEFKEDEIKFKVDCSKGTYIRSLCLDIAKKLGNIGCMISLNRTKSGEYLIENSYTLEDIEKGNFDLISIENALKSSFNIQIASEDELKEIRYGHYINKITKGKTLYLDKDRNPLGMYEYDDEKRITKCIRLF